MNKRVKQRSSLPLFPYELPKLEIPTLARYRMVRSQPFAELCRLFEERLGDEDKALFLKLAAKLELTFRPAFSSGDGQAPDAEA